MSSAIFICYRREDSKAEARAIHDHLHREFQQHGVFLDLQSVNPGDDFIDGLNQQLAKCKVMLVLIGKNWLNARDSGVGYLEGTQDFVRLELGSALTRPEVRILPVLLDNTKMPTEDQLPPTLGTLARRQAVPFRFDCFAADMRELIITVHKIIHAGDPREPPWASEIGIDGFGHWAEFRLDRVVQRMRWINPGEFLMGSPHDEPARADDEGPQHRVRLSPGFWLADSACTQAMWQAVMNGQNPAHFKNDLHNPVEQISHDDALQFLAKLGKRLGGGANPVLPTEAQWEYACRAGTTTPFCFGQQITSDHVNHDANQAYGNGPFGLYRKRTVPVKSLPPNPWGLFEMHGNVWEWCADGTGRPYPPVFAESTNEDPFKPASPEPEAHRVLRGGSWNDGPGGVRSACRFNFPRVFRVRTIGFRIAVTQSR